MNCNELVVALRTAGVNEGRYWVRGQDPSRSMEDGGSFLNLDADGGWFVGSHERGVTRVEQHFDSEEEACQYLYDFLTTPMPPPVRLTPEEYAAGLEITRREEAESLRRMTDRKARYESEKNRSGN